MAMSMGGGGVKAEPNVTPMIDVMLVLLIIFMIVIPALNAGFSAIPPLAQNLKPHPEEDQDQVLGIDKDGQYYLNKKPLPNADLADRLKEIYDKRQIDKVMYLKAHKELKYEKVLDAIDVAAHAGVRVTGMISRPFLIVSEISTRSLAFSSGISTVFMPPRAAASSFSFSPPIGSTRPRRVISPVMARSRRTGMPVITETIAVTMATPADGPSFGVAPSGTCTWISRLSNSGGSMPKATARERT